jgi:hypothetical protein
MLVHILGLDDPSGYWYLFWSGFAGSLDKLALAGAAYAVIRRHSCHEPRCWRVGRHHVDQDGIAFVYCRHHAR